MPRIRGNRVIDPHRLEGPERERIIDEVYAVHDSIFDGVDRAAFQKYVFDAPAERTRILLNLGEAGAIVGYCAVHFYVRTFDGRPCSILRSEIGLLRAYRGQSAAGMFLPKELARWRILHPTHPFFSQSSPVHPGTFAGFERFIPRFWPHWEQPTPPEVERLLFQLADDFGLQRNDPAHPYVCEVGWITRQTAQEAEYWKSCARPAAVFYQQQNPGYTRGTGLLTLFPIDAACLWFGVRQLLSKRLRALPGLRRLSKMRRVSPTQMLSRLQSTHDLAATDPAALDRAVSRVQHLVLSPGQVLFRKGDPPDALYVVCTGSVYVLPDDGEPSADTIVDQLGPGSLFGEMALLSGRARSATIRASGTTELLRMDRDTFFDLLQATPETADAVWRTVLQRQLDSFFRADPTVDHEAWGHAAVVEVWPAGAERVSGDEAGWLVLSGEVAVQRGQSTTLATAPAWFPTEPGQHLRARTSVRVGVLPRMND